MFSFKSIVFLLVLIFSVQLTLATQVEGSDLERKSVEKSFDKAHSQKMIYKKREHRRISKKDWLHPDQIAKEEYERDNQEYLKRVDEDGYPVDPATHPLP